MSEWWWKKRNTRRTRRRSISRNRYAGGTRILKVDGDCRRRRRRRISRNGAEGVVKDGNEQAER